MCVEGGIVLHVRHAGPQDGMSNRVSGGIRLSLPDGVTKKTGIEHRCGKRQGRDRFFGKKGRCAGVSDTPVCGRGDGPACETRWATGWDVQTGSAGASGCRCRLMGQEE